MLIYVNHNYCKLDEYHPGIGKLLSWSHKSYTGYGPNKKFKITENSCVDKQGRFLTGLLPRVLLKYQIPIIDQRHFPKINLEVPDLSDALRDYQERYLLEALKLCRCILKCSTGGGKTILMAAIIAAVGKKVLVIAPGIDVKNQLIVEFVRLLNKSFSISDDPNQNPQVLVSLPGRLKNLLDSVLKSYPVLLMDEVHGSAAFQCMNVILRNDAAYRFGFTATPTGRSDGRDLIVEGLFGPIIEIVDYEDLVEQGFLPDTRIDIYSGSFDGDYAYIEDLLIVNNTRRNNLIATIIMEHTRKTNGEVVLVLVRRVEHGKILSELIPGSIYLDGSTPSEDRDRAKEEAKNGKIKVIIATAIFAQGIDIPQITLGLNAAGGKSDILTVQRFGRVTRPFGGNVKRWCDFYDVYTKTLEKHSQERLKIYSEKTKNIHLHRFSTDKKRDLELEYLT